MATSSSQQVRSGIVVSPLVDAPATSVWFSSQPIVPCRTRRFRMGMVRRDNCSFIIGCLPWWSKQADLSTACVNPDRNRRGR